MTVDEEEREGMGRQDSAPDPADVAPVEEVGHGDGE